MPDILYAGSLTQDEVSTPFSLPTASRVAQIVSEN